MITKIGQVMVYVNDLEAVKQFWIKYLDFEVISEMKNEHMHWIELAPKGAATTIVLHNKEAIAKMSPELNLGTPSLMFHTNQFDELYHRLTSSNITVGDIMELPSGRVFNFADIESNYFAVMEV
ncbi:VOC family protein [Paenibacillus yanchengensis]|uniref:VOC family protein n=1 Tax=Paenibacillus yanchengensis TaxID=2035833 RepID=A0ABW4YLU1_9BACL